MTQTRNRHGKASPTLLFLIMVLAFLPLLMIGFYSVRSVASDNASRIVVQRGQNPIAQNHPGQIQETQIQSGQSRSINNQPSAPLPPRTGTQLHPVTETEYRERRVTVKVPELDPNTGKTVIRERQQIGYYPVTSTRWMQTYTTNSDPVHSPRVTQLAGELRGMNKDDAAREKKLNQLREELEDEFAELHQKQLAEIERTAKRLESLKILHDQRGENEKNIVDRRIDELLGKVDPLGWNPSLSYSAAPSSQQVPDQKISGQQRRSVSQAYNRSASSVAPQYTTTAPANYGQSSIGYPGPPHVPGSAPANQNYTRQRQLFPQPRDQKIPGSPIENLPHSSKLGTSDPYRSAVPLNQPAAAAPEVATESDAAAELAGSDYQPEVATTRIRVGVPQSALGEVFHLARSAAEANAELAAAKLEYEQYKELRAKGAIPVFDFQKAELKYNKSRREVKLINMQLEAFSEAMQRVKDLAESTLQRASAKLNATATGHRRGINSEQELVDAKYEVEKAKIALVDADANLKRLKETTAAVQAFDHEELNDKPSQSLPSDPTTSADTESAVAEQTDPDETR